MNPSFIAMARTPIEFSVTGMMPDERGTIKQVTRHYQLTPPRYRDFIDIFSRWMGVRLAAVRFSNPNPVVLDAEIARLHRYATQMADGEWMTEAFMTTRGMMYTLPFLLEHTDEKGRVVAYGEEEVEWIIENVPEHELKRLNKAILDSALGGDSPGSGDAGPADPTPAPPSGSTD